MAEMRYYTADLLANTVVAELPLYGVYMDKMLNAAGNFTGTYVLDTGVDFDQILFDGTIPGQHGLWVERDGVCIWAGPIWTRTYQSVSKTIQLTAQTFESVFEHIVFTSDQVYNAVEQDTILSTFLSSIQAQTNNGFGLTYSGPGATGITRSLQYLASEYKYAVELLSALAGATNGMDYTINPVSPTSKTFKALYAGATPAVSGLTFDYPGQIDNYWYSESAARGAIKSAAVGAGVIGLGTTSPLTGRPYWWQVGNFSDIADQTLIDSQASKMAKMPYVSPTFELSDVDAFMDGWIRLGETFVVSIIDARFPDGKTVTERLMGWSYTPEQSDTPENLKFILETDAA